MNRGARNPTLIRITRVLFLLDAAVWLAIGVFTLLRMPIGGPEGTMAILVVAVLILGNVGAMLLAGIGLGTQRRLWYFFAVAVLAVNIILTITDQFGLLDLLTLILDLGILGLLIATWSLYRTRKGK